MPDVSGFSGPVVAARAEDPVPPEALVDAAPPSSRIPVGLVFSDDPTEIPSADLLMYSQSIRQEARAQSADEFSRSQRARSRGRYQNHSLCFYCGKAGHRYR